ncbi:hypothetical protein [Arthrobacter sp. D2-10]
MASIDEKIQATKLVLHTPKSFAQVRAIGLEAASAASGGITKVTENEVDEHHSIQYTVKRAGFLTVITFGLVFNETEEAQNTVLLVPGQYLTSQATFLFIPLGPKDSAGYPPLKKFSDHVRNALSK